MTIPASPNVATIPESEANLPENTPSQPQPTLIKVLNETLVEHKEFALKSYLATLDPTAKHKSRQQQQLEIRNPVIRKFTVLESSDPRKFEYSETDNKGETKITSNGHLTNGKKWLINTFTLPGRGKELFAASTEIAKFLQIRDAFVMFTRYKQLRRLYATDEERKFLDSSSLGLSKLKSRQISLINVKNLYMVFGCKLIAKGVRVVDDYWEDDVISQGFTEKDQVFPSAVSFIKSKSTVGTSSQQTKSVAASVKSTGLNPHQHVKTTPITPQPTKEERMEYLNNSRTGETTQILPGQGISGGLELSSMATHPQYRGDSSSCSSSKQFSNKSLVSQLLSSSNSSSSNLSNSASTSSSKRTSNHIPINKSLKGHKSSTGLPYYDPTIAKRIIDEPATSLQEIEYLHDTVQTNTLLKNSRTTRTKQWKLYWQSKAGVDVGLTKDKTEDFFKRRREFMSFEQEDVRFNEYTNMDQVSTKRRRPNGNYLGACGLKGLKAPYLEKPEDPIVLEKKEVEGSKNKDEEEEEERVNNADENGDSMKDKVSVGGTPHQSVNYIGLSVN